MLQVLHYKIHDDLQVQIRRNIWTRMVTIPEIHLSSFQVPETSDPDIIINIGEFSPSNDGCYIVDKEYLIKKNYLYHKKNLGKISWEIEIFGIEHGKTVINFNYRYYGIILPFERLSIETFPLYPMIFAKLAEKNIFFLHAAGICRENKAFIFPGRGGSFKTSIVMDMIRTYQYQYLGDDGVFLEGSRMKSFPIFEPIFRYLLANAKDENFGLLDKIKIALSLWRSQAAGTGMRSNEPADLQAIIFLARTNTQQFEVRQLGLKEAVIKLVENNRIEGLNAGKVHSEFSDLTYQKFSTVYSYIFPDSKIAKYSEDYQNSLSDSLRDCPIFEALLPQKYDISITERIHAMIETLR